MVKRSYLNNSIEPSIESKQIIWISRDYVPLTQQRYGTALNNHYRLGMDRSIYWK